MSYTEFQQSLMERKSKIEAARAELPKSDKEKAFQFMKFYDKRPDLEAKRLNKK